ncbi:MAG: YIP1 family protein [candidate division KSB1 bacterium]|nr:YIP1 family protein [candidate division KSB1 bacterium]
MTEFRTCPACSKALPEDLQAQFCPYCGTDLEEVEHRSKTVGAPEPAEEPLERAGIPWEDSTDEWSFVQRLTRTWSQSMFQPGEFFRNMRVDGSAGPALLYAFILIVMGQSFNLFWQQLIVNRLVEQFGDVSPVLEQLVAATGAQQLLLVPLLTLLGLFIGTLIYHLCLVIVGGAKNGMAATFRVLAYSESSQLLLVIPILGQFIAMIWSVVLIIIGFKEVHETTTGRAVFAFLLPIIFCCALVLIMVLMVGSFLANPNPID